MTPKYKVGDIVTILEQWPTTKEVKIIHVYATTVPISYRAVNLKEISSGTVYAFLIEEHEILDYVGHETSSNCDCGSAKVYGLENCHSFWCSAYQGAEKKEKK